MPDINSTLAQFDAIEANLKKLDGLWSRMEESVPSTLGVANNDDRLQYEAAAEAFRRILAVMPTIGGKPLHDEIVEYDTILQWRLEIDEIENQAIAEKRIHAQETELARYRAMFNAKRRELVRAHVPDLMLDVGRLLARLQQLPRDGSSKLPESQWDELRALIDQIDVITGTLVQPAKRGDDLYRHLHFGCWNDLDDIILRDWPDKKTRIEKAMYGDEDPLPVGVTDITELLARSTTGSVVTSLNWSVLSPSDFERLVFALFSGSDGYENTDWLMHTNAPDGGRDIATFRVSNDVLAGVRRDRIIVQCKHQPGHGINIPEISALITQMKLWDQPPVDDLVIATTGRFTQDAVKWIEKNNTDRERPHIIMWPDNRLEQLLARRPDLVAGFGLRTPRSTV